MDEGGFDIIIGNPPYVDSEEMAKNLPATREYCKNEYQSAIGNWDLFIVFIERGMQLLKEGGILSFIVPNKILGAKYAEAIRKAMLNYEILHFRDYTEVDVFKDAHVYPIIFVIRKSSERTNIVNASLICP